MPRAKSTRHWHAMNGSLGCMPDSNDICHSKKEAIKVLWDRFDNILGMASELRRDGNYYFKDPASAGADYCQIIECYEEDCLKEDT